MCHRFIQQIDAVEDLGKHAQKQSPCYFSVFQITVLVHTRLTLAGH